MEVLSVMDAKKCMGLESLKLQPLPQCKVAHWSKGGTGGEKLLARQSRNNYCTRVRRPKRMSAAPWWCIC